MTNDKDFNFKAATGFGAVVDGTVTSSSAEQVSGDLLKQGLIPVRIWPDKITIEQGIWSRTRTILRQLIGRRRSSQSGAI